MIRINSLKLLLPLILFSIGILMLGTYALIDKELKYDYMRESLNDHYTIIGNRISNDIENRDLLKTHENTKLLRIFAQYATEYLNTAKIYDHKNNIIFKTLQTTYSLKDKININKKVLEEVKNQKVSYVKIDIDNKRVYGVFYLMMPIQKNQLKSEDIGILYLEFDISQIIKRTIQDMYKSVIVNGIIIFIVMLIFYFILNIKVFRRINNLLVATKELKNGNFDVKIDDKGDDEISIVVNAYKDMAIQLKEQFEQVTKSKEHANKANKAKSEFLANMSHEIRTPLNAVLGFIDLLKEESYDSRTLEYINIIDESSKGLLQIIEDILDFSKIESGKIDIDKIDFNLKNELSVISHLFQAKCSQSNINFSVIFDDNLPIAINTDSLRVKQVIANLISNAIKFTKAHKNIVVKFEYKDGFLKISVKDEGKGIAKDKIEHIFQAFEQEDSSTTREYGGTGLGLSISSELVKLLGGELKVKSELGVGSEFYFSIPAKIAQEVNKKNKNIVQVDFRNKKILLVEDNKANQIFMKVILKKMDLSFDIANDGLEALENFKVNKYDAILMDENMPKMNGTVAAKRILEIEKELGLSHTPIIALTANALKGDREKFLAVGMDEYMTKPVNKHKLSEVLEKILR